MLVRFVSLSRERIEVTAGTPVLGPRLEGRRFVPMAVRGPRGIGRTSRLRLIAPEEPGEYRLFVAVGGHADSAEVIVTEPEAQP